MKRTTLLVIAFVLMSCSSFNITKFFSLKSDKATATVGDNGAELTLKDNAQLLINAGGVKAGSEVTFSVMDVSKWDNPVPEGLEINKIYTVEASEWTDDLEANLTLPLDLKDVPPAEWDNYGIAYFSEGQWIQVPSSIDPQKGISATVNHFSIFTIIKRIFNPAPKVMVNVSPDKYDNKPADQAQPGQLEDLQVDVSAYDPKGERLTVLVTFGYKSAAGEAGYDILGSGLAVATGAVRAGVCISSFADALRFVPTSALACIPAVALAEGIKPPTKNIYLDQYWYRMNEVEPGHFSLTASPSAIQLDSYLTKVYVFIEVYDSLKDAPVEKTVEIPVVAYQISDAPEPVSPGPSAELVCPPSPAFTWQWSGKPQSSGSYRFRLVRGDNLWGSWFDVAHWTCSFDEGTCDKGGPNGYFAQEWSPTKPLAEGVYSWGFKASDKNGESDFNDSTISSSKIYQFRVDKKLSGSECQVSSPKPEEMAQEAVTDEVVVTEEPTSLPTDAVPQTRHYVGEGVLESCPFLGKSEDPDSCTGSDCEGDQYGNGLNYITAEITIDGNGNVSGIFERDIPIQGVRESITGIKPNEYLSYVTQKVTARLTNDDQILEGSYSEEPDFSKVPKGYTVCAALINYSFTLHLQS
ncbi:MAG: hypothetical protein MUO64_20025 [Anaerolineales bacterium]|nr:hypothetical protein [Anaerolineales bacterium]